MTRILGRRGYKVSLMMSARASFDLPSLAPDGLSMLLAVLLIPFFVSDASTAHSDLSDAAPGAAVAPAGTGPSKEANEYSST